MPAGIEQRVDHHGVQWTIPGLAESRGGRSRYSRLGDSAKMSDSATRASPGHWAVTPAGPCAAGSLAVTLQLCIFIRCSAQANILTSLASRVAAIILLFE